jgi:hypothetical protein
MRPAPLFKDDLPFMRPRIAGFERGMRVEIPDHRRAGLMRRGHVIVTLPHFNQVVIHTDDGATVDIAPERVRRIL